MRYFPFSLTVTLLAEARVEAGDESALATSDREGSEPELAEEVMIVQGARPEQEMIAVAEMRGPRESRSQGRPVRKEPKSDNWFDNQISAFIQLLFN